MARPKVIRRKIKTGITIEPDLFDWVQTKIKTKEFANLTHAVEKGLLLLKEKLDSNGLFLVQLNNGTKITLACSSTEDAKMMKYVIDKADAEGEDYIPIKIINKK